MKKKAIIAAVILIVIGSVASFFVYSYFNPKIEILVGGTVEKKDWYFESVVFAKKEKFGMPIPDKTMEHYKDFTSEVIKLTAEVEKDLIENYAQDFKVKAYYEEKDGKTIFSYAGTATTKDGEPVEYKKELVFDYIISKDTKLIRNTSSE